MKITINNKIKNELLLGSLYYGTGGGGSIKLANIFYKKIKNIELTPLKEIPQNNFCVAIFGVGPASSGKNPLPYARKALEKLEEVTKNKISGIIPVEIGPAALACAMYFASNLKIPLIDADFVGGRSAPEVYLETITLFNLSRTPLVAVSEKNNILVIKKKMGFIELENKLRNFSKKEECPIYVAGYMFTPKILKGKIEEGTVTEVLKSGSNILRGIIPSGTTKIFEGKVVSIKKVTSTGFDICQVTLRSNKAEAKLIIKNEFLGLYINDKLTISCPDLIICFNKKYQPLYSTDIKEKMNIVICARKSRLLWRTNKGVKLFSPKIWGEKSKSALL